MRALAIILGISLSACTQFPDLDDTVSPEVESADFPALLPLEPLLAGAGPVVTDPAATTQSLQARVTALRARARALQRRAIVDPATRARMQDRFG